MRFKKETTDREVLEYLHTERGGDLEHLDLASTDITDFALTVIVNLPKLKRLNLLTTRITDEGLFTLSYAQELTILNLNECEFITPTGIRYLGRLHKLTTLYINSTKCNDEAIEVVISLFLFYHSTANRNCVDHYRNSKMLTCGTRTVVVIGAEQIEPDPTRGIAYFHTQKWTNETTESIVEQNETR